MKVRHSRFAMGAATACVALLVTLGIGAASVPGSALTTPEDRQKFLSNIQNQLVIVNGVENYVLIEGRFPETLKDVCSGPYTAIRCEDLANPYTGKPITGKEEPGDIWFSRSGDYFKVNISWIEAGKTRNLGLSERMSEKLEFVRKIFAPPEFVDGVMRRYGSDHDRRVRLLSPASKRAFAVGNYLDIRSGAFASHWAITRRQSHPWPPTFSSFLREIEGYASDWVSTGRWPDLMVGGPAYMIPPASRLANDFTGGFAKAVDAPSPGDFRYTVQADGSAVIESFGENGTVVYRAVRYRIVPATPAGQ